MKALRSEFIADLASHIADELTSAGIDPDTATHKALESADAFAERWQGLHLYIPKNNRKRVVELHTQIRNEFTGNNHQALAVKYGMHLRTIYKILKEDRRHV